MARERPHAGWLEWNPDGNASDIVLLDRHVSEERIALDMRSEEAKERGREHVLRGRGDSPYLPSARSAWRETLVRSRAQAAYRVWRRAIHRYGNWPEKTPDAVHILDVGCGSGDLSFCLEQWYKTSVRVALDIDTDLVRYARRRVHSVRMVQANAEALPLGDAAFHVVSALQVVEHLPDPDRFLAEARRVLERNGLLLVATPNPRGTAARLLKARWQGYREDHVSLRFPSQWRAAIEKAGFRVLSEGTTLFNGLPVIGRFPLGLPFLAMQAIFGWFPWYGGESYMSVARRYGAP